MCKEDQYIEYSRSFLAFFDLHSLLQALADLPLKVRSLQARLHYSPIWVENQKVQSIHVRAAVRNSRLKYEWMEEQMT